MKWKIEIRICCCWRIRPEVQVHNFLNCQLNPPCQCNVAALARDILVATLSTRFCRGGNWNFLQDHLLTRAVDRAPSNSLTFRLQHFRRKFRLTVAWGNWGFLQDHLLIWSSMHILTGAWTKEIFSVVKQFKVLLFFVNLRLFFFRNCSSLPLPMCQGTVCWQHFQLAVDCCQEG